MRDAQARTIYLKDYQQPEFLIDHTELHVELGEQQTLVRSRLHMSRNPDTAQADELRLDGQDMTLIALRINGRELSAAQYRIEEEALVVPGVGELLGAGQGDAFVVECEVTIEPQKNTSLEGLYKSSQMFCTQCEAEGFRKIIYYL